MYNLQEDLGETTNLAAERPNLVKELDALIDRFLADTGALVPKANPAYDPQVAMLLGWVPKFCTTAVEGEVLKVTGEGRKPFIATVRLKARGPLELRARLRCATDGEGLVQWRTADQKAFPPKGQTTAYKLLAGDWRDVRVPLAADGEVIHLRLYLPAVEKPVEIDWVELWQPGAAAPVGRWDFHKTK